MRIVFMGTPDIAAACLEKLLTEHMNVVAVYTKPDTPQNRGMKLTQSPVKRVALAHEIPVYQPARIWFRSLASRLDRGSSIRKTWGSRTMARPMATRWR